jgi:AraC family transcriptional regulator
MTNTLSALALTQASEKAGVHPVHVSRSFRSTLGCTFREYLTLTRLRKATDLLKPSPRDITEIAVAGGFSDHAHFTRTFKRATGLTPMATEFKQVKRIQARSRP